MNFFPLWWEYISLWDLPLLSAVPVEQFKATITHFCARGLIFLLFEDVDKPKGEVLVETQRHLLVLPFLLSFICTLGNELLGSAATR